MVSLKNNDNLILATGQFTQCQFVHVLMSVKGLRDICVLPCLRSCRTWPASNGLSTSARGCWTPIKPKAAYVMTLVISYHIRTLLRLCLPLQKCCFRSLSLCSSQQSPLQHPPRTAAVIHRKLLSLYPQDKPNSSSRPPLPQALLASGLAFKTIPVVPLVPSRT